MDLVCKTRDVEDAGGLMTNVLQLFHHEII